MINGDAVKAFADHFRKPEEIGGFIATPNDWHIHDPESLRKPATPETLKVYSLGAVRDYLHHNRDAADLSKVIVHVVSPHIVTVSSQLALQGRYRESYVQANALNLTDGFLGKFLAIEEFIIGLQTRFVSTDDMKTVLRLFGTVKHEGTKTLTDDGVTQIVTAKAGIVLASDVAVPNPVTLTPYRTFREIDQPPSLFVLRVNGSNQGTLTAGLFEADGGAWRIQAVESIARWLRVAVPDNVAVLA